MKTKVITYQNDKQLQGIQWVAKNASLSVSLTVAAAFNELYTAHMFLREHRDVFRNEVKRFANEAELRARRKRRLMLDIIANRQFFDTYSDKVIDLAESDITQFRISVQQKMDDAGCRESELLSYVETARVMLTAADMHFDGIMRLAHETYGGYDYEGAFCEFCVSDVQKSWSRMCDILYTNVGPDIDLNTKQSEQMFGVIGDSFRQGKYIDACLREAHAEQPEWVEKNLLLVEEDTSKANV